MESITITIPNDLREAAELTLGQDDLKQFIKEYERMLRKRLVGDIMNKASFNVEESMRPLYGHLDDLPAVSEPVFELVHLSMSRVKFLDSYKEAVDKLEHAMKTTQLDMKVIDDLRVFISTVDNMAVALKSTI